MNPTATAKFIRKGTAMSDFDNVKQDVQDAVADVEAAGGKSADAPVAFAEDVAKLAKADEALAGNDLHSRVKALEAKLEKLLKQLEQNHGIRLIESIL